ncbi:MAG TPA: CdaR family protein [Vicinamibacterales bacterium]|nr:CdaR family protein [Vicinamibacterales bacterium]
MIWPFRHFGLKVTSLTLAVLLWMAVAGEETVERGLRIPLELQQIPSGIELTGDVPSAVDVRVRGASGALSRIGPGDVVAVLDLRGARAGRRLFPLTPDQVRTPVGVDVAQVTPSAIAMVFEASVTRTVPVVPSVDGRPAPGFVVGTLKADPATVDIVGPESAVKRATEALTEPVLIAGAKDRVQETVTIGMLDPTLRIQNAKTAVVTVQMEPAPLERTFRSRPIHLRNLAATLVAQAEPAVVDVMLRGSRDGLARISPDEVDAYIDVAGLGAGQYMLNVHADAGRDAGVTRIEPSLVQVRITRGQQ